MIFQLLLVSPTRTAWSIFLFQYTKSHLWPIRRSHRQCDDDSILPESFDSAPWLLRPLLTLLSRSAPNDSLWISSACSHRSSSRCSRQALSPPLFVFFLPDHKRHLCGVDVVAAAAAAAADARTFVDETVSVFVAEYCCGGCSNFLFKFHLLFLLLLLLLLVVLPFLRQRRRRRHWRQCR